MFEKMCLQRLYLHCIIFEYCYVIKLNILFSEELNAKKTVATNKIIK